ncbi:unnamed protein product [Onchocerca flexuosa]|uniref:Polysaccharide deacetylase n=1 Tax=Onchocerca flexuosa TaxID=387005 RepID=A0A183HVK3_9BILA|nr:unnamed protein product [Onchocerca flexuosa]
MYPKLPDKYRRYIPVIWYVHNIRELPGEKMKSCKKRRMKECLIDYATCEFIESNKMSCHSD